MTDTPMALEVNCETGETVERQLTVDELAQRETDAAAYLAQVTADETAQAAKDAARASAIAKLAALGLTAVEAAAIVGV